MRKHLSILTVAILALALAACGGQGQSGGGEGSGQGQPTPQSSPQPSETASPQAEKRTYTDDLGVTVELPVHPQRVVVATWHYPGHLISLGITPVGVFGYAKDSEFFGEQLKDAQLLTQESVEEVLALQPDLIITDTTNPNVDKLRSIAPTVAFDLTRRQNRLETLVDIGEILGKKDEAEKQIRDWEAKLAVTKQRFEQEFDKNAVISVIGDYQTEFYAYGPNYGRGTEILYTHLGLNYPEKMRREYETTGQRYVQLSEEVVPEFVGDYVFISGETPGAPNILDDPMYVDLPAVKEGRVYYIYEPSFYFSDPISLNGQLEFFERVLLDGAAK
mgnify:CR=1 FL=1